MENEVAFDGNVIIVIEGIDSFHEMEFQHFKEAHLKFWLPKTLPNRIRFIVTADAKSLANKYLHRIGCEKIKITSEKKVISHVIEKYQKKDSFVHDEHKNKIFEIMLRKQDLTGSGTTINTMFTKSYLSVFCPYPSDIVQMDKISQAEVMGLFSNLNYSELESINNIFDLLRYTLSYFESKIIPKDSFIKLMCILSITQKGLSIEEMNRIVPLEEKKWLLILSLFKSFLMLYKGLWKNNNEFLKKCIEEMYLMDQVFVECLHKEIAESISQTPNSIRKLEEQTYNLFCSKEYFILKQVVSNIESFLLLFNPLNKYDLCRYWQILENKGYDPVIEYNKAIELFDMHHLPTPEELFKISLQISIFLKEFSDFETSETPVFRHPNIRNKILDLPNKNPSDEMNSTMPPVGTRKKKTSKLPAIEKKLNGNPFEFDIDDDSNDKQAAPLAKITKTGRQKVDLLESIGVLGELQKLGLVDRPKEKKNPKKKKRVEEAPAEVTGGKDQKEPEKKDKKDEREVPLEKESLETLRNKKATNEDFSADKSKEILAPHERCNLETPGGRKMFRDYHVALLNAKNTKMEYKSDEKNDDYVFKVEDLENQNKEEDQIQVDAIARMIPKEDLKGLYEINLKINQDRSSEFYYYKRWIWLIFPWVSISADPRHQFSSEIARCYSSSTKYMSVQEEKIFTKQALQIAIEAKQKKMAIYSKVDINGSKLKKDSTMPNLERTKSNVSESSKVITKVESDSVLISRGGALIQTSNSVARIGDGPAQKQKKSLLTNPLALKKKAFFVTDGQASRSIANQGRDQEKSIQIESASRLQNDSKNFGSTSVLEKSRLEDNLRGVSLNKGLDTFSSSKLDKDFASVLSKLKDNMMEISGKEINFLQDKHDSLIKELNNLKVKTRERKHYLDEMKVQIRAMLEMRGGMDEEISTQRILQLNSHLSEADAKLIQETQTKERMKKIINICELNKEQDQVWIRGLNFVLSNYKKMIQFEENTINDAKRDVESLINLNFQYADCFNEKKESHQNLLEGIEESKMNQQRQDLRVAMTNKLIEDSIYEHSKKEPNEEEDDVLRPDEKQGTLKQDSTLFKSPANKLQKIKKDLELYQSQYEICKPIFEIDPEKPFYESEKFKDFIDRVEHNRFLTVFPKRESLSQGVICLFE